MTDTDERFDQQIHDAFRRIELGAESQERMLSQLLAAQAAREDSDMTHAASVSEPEELDDARAGESGRTDARETESKGRVLRMRDRRRWWVALPVAAALLAAVIVVRMNFGSNVARMDMVPTSDASSASEEYSIKETGASSDNAVVMQNMMDEKAYEDEALPSDVVVTLGADAPLAESATAQMSELYPLVTLENGATYTTLADDLPTQLDVSDVGSSLGEATASDPDMTAQVECEVFELSFDSDARAVRYADEDAFWLCTPVAE